MAKPGSADEFALSEAVTEIGFNEICTVYRAAPEFIAELVAHGIIEPKGNSTVNWRFDARQIKVIRVAIRLHHDLEVNHAGIALAIDLLNQINELQDELNILQKYVAMRE